MARILVIDDNETVREGVAAICMRLQHDVSEAESGLQGVRLFELRPFDLVVTDLKMDGLDGLAVLKQVKALAPDTAVIVMTGYGTIETAVEAMKAGAFNFVEKVKFQPEHVRMQVQRALEWRELEKQNERLRETTAALSKARDAVQPEEAFRGMVGQSAIMRELFTKLQKVARADTNVHVHGESGTGKELVAQALHDESRRAGGPLIKVNCGAIPETLLESELFGHEKGAFTGAIKRKLGRFELAHGGTIFLDEIGELSPAMQVKLLRVLQEREIERVGGEAPVKVDVRVISATNRDLKAEVEAGRFREDLYYRLHVVPLTLPPLRERTDDIIPLARHFVEKCRKRTNPDVRGLAAETESQLRAYHYPGNVRELENIIEQAMVFATPPYVVPEDLPAQLVGMKPRVVPFSFPDGGIDLNAVLEAQERQMIIAAYERAAGVKKRTADLLNIKSSALYYKLEKYGVGTVAGRDLSDEADPTG